MKIDNDTEAHGSPAMLSADLPLSEQIGFLIRKLYQKNQTIWNEQCLDDQITSPQSAVLFTLSRQGPCSLTELGRATAMDPATTRGVVDRLNKRQMISLQDDETDRRKVILHLDHAGRDFVERMRPIIPQIADATLSPLNVAEQIALHYLLLKLTQEEPGGAMRTNR
jgi:DNA-binding MarR family transcriptional regulator